MKFFFAMTLVLTSLQAFAVSGSPVSCVYNGSLVSVGESQSNGTKTCTCQANGTQDAIWGNCTQGGTMDGFVNGGARQIKRVK